MVLGDGLGTGGGWVFNGGEVTLVAIIIAEFVVILFTKGIAGGLALGRGDCGESTAGTGHGGNK